VSGADASKWSVRLNGLLYVAQTISAVDFDRLHLFLPVVGENAGADQISYSNAPSDISDTLGRGLSAFEVVL
jgi:hypothetical protein